MSASDHSAFSDLNTAAPPRAQGPGVVLLGRGYQLAVVLVMEVKLSSAVDRLSTAAINEV
jgi:hypothetical protein